MVHQTYVFSVFLCFCVSVFGVLFWFILFPFDKVLSNRVNVMLVNHCCTAVSVVFGMFIFSVKGGLRKPKLMGHILFSFYPCFWALDIKNSCAHLQEVLRSDAQIEGHALSCLCLIGPSGVRALPLAAGRNEGGHYYSERVVCASGAT